MPKFHTLVFIGRFQPYHLGHQHVIVEALESCQQLVVLVGSANSSRSPRNPFSFEERNIMIRRSLVDAGFSEELTGSKGYPPRIQIKPIDDYPYNDDAWIAGVQSQVMPLVPIGSVSASDYDHLIGVVGFNKDHTSYYLKKFPQWGSLSVRTQHGSINSTDIRNDFLRANPILPSSSIVPGSVLDFMAKFYFHEEFKWLLAEKKFYDSYDASKFPVFVTTVDAVCVQSGHVLLVHRKNSPGKGLLALPGGHVNPDETLQAAVVRELDEETGLSDGKGRGIPPAVLASYIRKREVFDSPTRSQRGRVITHAYLFQFPQREELFPVEGADDAAHAGWYKIGTLDPRTMFEDHGHIIETMTGTKI